MQSSRHKLKTSGQPVAMLPLENDESLRPDQGYRRVLVPISGADVGLQRRGIKAHVHTVKESNIVEVGQFAR